MGQWMCCWLSINNHTQTKKHAASYVALEIIRKHCDVRTECGADVTQRSDYLNIDKTNERGLLSLELFLQSPGGFMRVDLCWFCAQYYLCTCPHETREHDYPAMHCWNSEQTCRICALMRKRTFAKWDIIHSLLGDFMSPWEMMREFVFFKTKSSTITHSKSLALWRIHCFYDRKKNLRFLEIEAIRNHISAWLKHNYTCLICGPVK